MVLQALQNYEIKYFSSPKWLILFKIWEKLIVDAYPAAEEPPNIAALFLIF